MKFSISGSVFFVILSINNVATAQRANYRPFNTDYKFHSNPDGRSDPRYYTYSNTEFDHAINDDRCDDQQRDSIQIVKETSYGNVHGRQIYLCDSPGVPLQKRPGSPTAYGYRGSVRVFLGVPYAEPPVRRRDLNLNYQLKPPEKVKEFRDLHATRYKPACPQNKKYLQKDRGINTTDEDCLYLNIFSPGELSLDQPKEKYAVMFYIHDGNFDHGSGSLFPAHVLASSQRVVVVTFNYRLGHLGFLATGDQSSMGNYGILDQVEALKWVSENIHVFDGDATRITVFGTGAGAASASLLALSPLSNSYVKRVIAQNGAPIADWAAIVEPLFMFNTSQILGEELGCQIQDFTRLVECVGTRSKEIEILKIKPRVGWIPWGPVLDNFTRPASQQFLPLAPEDLLERGVLFKNGFAYMSGVSRDAGASIFLEDQPATSNLEIDEIAFSEKIRRFMKMYNYSVNAKGIFESIKFMYDPPVDPLNKTLLREEYIHLLTDRYYVAPLDKMLQLLMKNKVSTYAYVLNYTFQGYSLPLKDFVSQDMDYLLLTGAPFMSPKFYPEYLELENASWSEEDRNMSQFMMEAWANFAKEGNPTPTRIFNTILWEPVTEKSYAYLNLNATNTTSTMIVDFRARESRFWNTFLPFFIDREPPTLPPTLEPGVYELRVVTSALWGSVVIASLLLTITLIFCILYCRVRRFKDRIEDDLNSSREIIVNRSKSVQDTPV